MNAAHRRTPHRPWASRGVVLLPLVLLSAAWTVSVANLGGPAVLPSASDVGGSPDPVQVPDAAVEPAGSVARPVRFPDKGTRTVRTAAEVQIPAAALAAYQRAATVITSADETCHLAWPLLAAIGRVESDHGRTRGSVLNADGVARPSIVGIRLDGRRGTSLISDTDGGRYDGDRSFDRAVGPLQFIPTTWGVVGVDADGDGARNPQDIDDAALAAAVHLCSGTGDLGQAADRRRALLRYNHSQAYVRLVLSAMHSYMSSEGALLAGRLVTQSAPLRADGGERPHRTPEPAPAALEKPSGGRDGRAPASRPAPVDPAPAPAPVAPLNDLVTRAGTALACTVNGLSALLQQGLPDTCVTDLLAP